MAEQIIKLLEYITNHPLVQGSVIAWVVFGAITVLFGIAVFIFAFCVILRVWKEMK